MNVRTLIKYKGVVAGGYLKQPATGAFALWVAHRSRPKQEWDVDVTWVLLPDVSQPTYKECKQAVIEKLTPKRRGK